MPKILQRWQFGSQAEQSLEAECAMAQQYGFDGIMAKALDGTMWMGRVDGNADALRSAEDVRRQSDYCHSLGLSFYVWVNPLQQDMGTQADLVAACINACDGAAFDTEPYAGFLGAYPPVGLCQWYMQRVTSQTMPGKAIILQPDPRPGHLLEVRFADEWAPYATHYSPQDYVSDFYNSPTYSLMDALLADCRQIAADHQLIAWPTLPGNAAASLMATDTISTFEGFCVWRIGSAPGGTLRYLGGIDMAQPDSNPCAELQAQIDTRDVFIADIADRIVFDQIAAELARKTAGGAAASPRRAVLQSIAQQAEASRAQILGPRPPSSSHEPRPPLLKEDPSGNLTEGANPH
jgi:hypothetical protein